MYACTAIVSFAGDEEDVSTCLHAFINMHWSSGIEQHISKRNMEK